MHAEQDNNPEGEQFRKLFIGGLDYRTTDQSLKNFYEQWGEIVDVVVMKHPQTQKSRGFGFVTYAVASMVDEAMKNRPHKIDGREVDSKRAVPRDVSMASGAATNVNVKKMFVGGLKEQTEEELREYFGQFGTIIGVNILIDKATNKRKGYAFIEYNDYDPVDKALLVRDHQVAGKSVTVKKAVVKDGPGGPGGPAGRGGRGGGRGGARAPSNSWGNGGGGGWGGSNGYSNASSGPWDGSQGNGWGGNGWDQYGGGGGGWNGASSSGGYGQQGGGYGGGPVRSNYNNSGQRNAPYGGGYSGGQWGGNARY